MKKHIAIQKHMQAKQFYLIHHMNNHSYFENFHDNAVLAKGNLIFKISRLKQAIQEIFINETPNSFNNSLFHKIGCELEANSWFTEEGGTDWELLDLGAERWQKGKIRVSIHVEFISDEEEESPLDEIRQSMNDS